MRGVRGTQESRLPVTHWRADEGGASCGARRKWGALTTRNPRDVDCTKAKCRDAATAAGKDTAP